MRTKRFLASDHGSTAVKFAVILELAAVVLLTLLSSIEAGANSGF